MAKHLYLLSDSVGETVLRVSRATTIQFENWSELEFRTHFNLVSKAQIDQIIAEARLHESCFIYTLVAEDLSSHLAELLAMHNIPALDIMGPALDIVGGLLESKPMYSPGLTYKLDASYYERIEAMEFAVRYDDGKNPRGFLAADLVLIGVSRTSKTPLSMYLANRGFKVANLPLILGGFVPEELEQVPKERIIGLTISAEKLLQVRQERLKELRLPPEVSYAQKGQIEKELQAADALFQRLDCQVIDVTYKAIEETASKISELLMRQKKEAESSIQNS